MKKIGKIMGITILLFAVFCIGSSSTKAAEVKTFGNYEYKVLDESKKTAALVHINNPGKIVNIPGTIDGYTVAQVGGIVKVLTSNNKTENYVAKKLDLEHFEKYQIFSQVDGECQVRKVTLLTR